MSLRQALKRGKAASAFTEEVPAKRKKVAVLTRDRTLQTTTGKKGELA